MGVADVIALRSPCSRRQIGAVIVSPTNRIIATGYNGFPADMVMPGPHGGIADRHFPTCSNDCPRGAGKVEAGVGYDECLTIHAEANALMFCDRRDREGGMMYVTSATCISCAKLIANSGLSVVVMRIAPEDAHRDPVRGITIMQDSGVKVWHI